MFCEVLSMMFNGLWLFSYEQYRLELFKLKIQWGWKKRMSLICNRCKTPQWYLAFPILLLAFAFAIITLGVAKFGKIK